MRQQSYEDQITEAADAVGACLKALRQAPRGLKPYRLRELDEARRALRELVRRPLSGQKEQRAQPLGPRCPCGAELLATRYGPVCAAGTHDD